MAPEFPALLKKKYSRDEILWLFAIRKRWKNPRKPKECIPIPYLRVKKNMTRVHDLQLEKKKKKVNWSNFNNLISNHRVIFYSYTLKWSCFFLYHIGFVYVHTIFFFLKMPKVINKYSIHDVVGPLPLLGTKIMSTSYLYYTQYFLTRPRGVSNNNW